MPTEYQTLTHFVAFFGGLIKGKKTMKEYILIIAILKNKGDIV